MKEIIFYLIVFFKRNVKEEIFMRILMLYKVEERTAVERRNNSRVTGKTVAHTSS